MKFKKGGTPVEHQSRIMILSTELRTYDDYDDVLKNVILKTPQILGKNATLSSVITSTLNIMYGRQAARHLNVRVPMVKKTI